MYRWFVKKWNYISNLGVKQEYTASVQKRIILTNQLAVVAFTALFIMSLTYIFKQFHFNIFSFINLLAVCSILTILIINKKGGYKITTITLSVLTPILTLLFTTISKQYLYENDVTFYFYGRFLLIAELCVPLILIDFNRKITLFLTVLINIACIFLYDPFHNLLNLGFFQVENLVYNSYYTINYIIIFPISILLFGFYFLMNLNLKYEKRINNLVIELTEKNEVLYQQKEEITTTLEEISLQKEIIVKASNIIEIKNKNITDSIMYAKRIQTAVLPSFDSVKSVIDNIFIYYNPRDIVSGDFYWFTEVENKKIIVAADCTGHGVPGAFVSILGIALLKEIIFLRDIYRPDLILNELRNQIKLTFGQSGKSDETKDGMDIALCQIDTNKKMLLYSGANNSLYKISNQELIEIKADRQPIGIYAKEKEFSVNEIFYTSDDLFYIFSDGYSSQFGGEKNEKYKSHRFKSLLLQISDQDLSIQKELIEKGFWEWKGDFEQVDDILVIGFSI
jgi:serine phosphatase RsbU (regulator of sigma subunit)